MFIVRPGTIESCWRWWWSWKILPMMLVILIMVVVMTKDGLKPSKNPCDIVRSNRIKQDLITPNQILTDLWRDNSRCNGTWRCWDRPLTAYLLCGINSWCVYGWNPSCRATQQNYDRCKPIKPRCHGPTAKDVWNNAFHQKFRCPNKEQIFQV